jgi:hypothetical protein
MNPLVYDVLFEVILPDLHENPKISEACKLSIELRYRSDYEGLAMKTRLSLWMAIAT